jgi:hypothetical protein
MSSTCCDVAKEDFTHFIFLETSGHATNRSLRNFISSFTKTFVLFTSSLEAWSRYLLFKRSTSILDILACDKNIFFIIYTVVKRLLLLDASDDY